MKAKNSDSSRKRTVKTPKSVKPPAATAGEALMATKFKAAAKARAAVKFRPAPDPLPAKRPAKPRGLKIPPILLEGDIPAAPPAGGPGERFVLGPVPPAAQAAPVEPELPESYGTQELFLTARDPRWLYAHWDFSSAQLKKCNAQSADGHLLLRIFRNAFAGEPLLQIHLHPESRHWFVPVPHAGAKYLAVLGYHDARGKWMEKARSGATITPPDSVAEDTSVHFASIPIEVPFVKLLATVKAVARENLPLARALQELRAEGFSSLPGLEQMDRRWTPAQEKALAEVVSVDQARRIWIGSVEVTELIRRQLDHEVSSVAAAQFGLASSPQGAFSLSSPFGGAARPRGFWFNVNAELIVYGSTQPDATVTIGDRPIKLRRDGSFSFRFALPDGHYELPAVAQSADGEETRAAGLKFSRQSEYQGNVEKHPQDERLQPPLASAVA